MFLLQGRDVQQGLEMSLDLHVEPTGALRFTVLRGNSNVASVVYGGEPIKPGRWVHVAFVMRAIFENARFAHPQLFINGEERPGDRKEPVEFPPVELSGSLSVIGCDALTSPRFSASPGTFA